METLIARGYNIEYIIYLSRSWEHALASIEPSAAGILNFLDLTPLLPND